MKKVAVVMSTFNGEKYLEEQIDSILKQKNVELDLYIRDDCSSDKTKEILMRYERYKNVFIKYATRNVGYGKNFIENLFSIKKDYDFYSFADQDDVWENNKLIMAVSKLESKDKPSLYYSSLKYVDENLNFIDNKKFDKVDIYNNFIRHRTAGCTYVFNNHLYNLAKSLDFKLIESTLEHDVFIMDLCLSIDSYIFCDDSSYILYRQHGNNVTGLNQGILKRLKKEVFYHYSEDYKKNYRKKIALMLLNNNLELKNRDFLEIVSTYNESLVKKHKLIKILSKYKNNNLFFYIVFFEILFNSY